MLLPSLHHFCAIEFLRKIFLKLRATFNEKFFPRKFSGIILQKFSQKDSFRNKRSAEKISRNTIERVLNLFASSLSMITLRGEKN
jgi:hypothetical protein